MRRLGPLLLSLVALLGSPARAGFPVAAPRPLAPTLGITANAMILATDAGFLALWRTRTTFWADGLPQVALLSPDGDLVARSTLWDLPLFFAWDGASSGDQVLFVGHCNDPSGGTFCAVRLSADGRLLGTTLLPRISVAATAVASDGDGFLVAFLTSDGRALAIPVSADGTASEAVTLGSWNFWEAESRTISATATAETLFVTFRSTSGQMLARISPAGVEASVALDPPFDLANATIEGSGELLLVVTMPKAPIGDPRARAAIFDRDLVRLSEWLPIEGAWQAAVIAPTNSGWIAAGWRSGPSGATDASVVAMSRTGFVGQPTPLPEVNGSYVEMAARDDHIALLWTTQSGYRIPGYFSNELRLGMFDASAAATRDASTISLGPAPQVDPAAAHGGGATLAAWTERAPDGSFVVKARPFDAAGAPLSPPVTMPASGTNQYAPRVSWGDSSFLVVWSEPTPVGAATLAARVAPDGRLLDPEAIRVAEAGSYSSVDWSGAAWVVVSATDRLAATRVASTGALLDGVPVPIAAAPEGGGGVGRSEIDCNGSACLVAWEAHDPFQCPPFECEIPDPAIEAARIAHDLTVLDPVPRRLTEDYEEVSALTVSWNGTADAWLVAWSLDGSKRVTATGLVIERPERPAEGDRFAGSLSAIAESAGWRLAWSPARIPERYGSSLGSDAFHGWSATGTIRDVSERRAIAATPEREWNPLLVAAPRPLAFFLRESQISAGSPTVLGQFLDETEIVPTTITATATRLDDATVRLTWTSDVPGVTQFRIHRFDDRYDFVLERTFLGPSSRSVDIALPAGRAGRFVVRAYSASGPVESNVVVVPGNRTRYVTRYP